LSEIIPLFGETFNENHLRYPKALPKQVD